MNLDDFSPNENCWFGAEDVRDAVDEDCTSAFIQARLANKRMSDERLLYMAQERSFKVLKTAITLAIAEKKEPRVGKIIEWMIASQMWADGNSVKCKLSTDGVTIAEAIAPALKFLSNDDWNKIVGHVFSYVDGNFGKIKKVLKLFGKTVSVNNEDAIDGEKTYVIPGKYDRVGVVRVGGYLVMNRDLSGCCDYEEAKALEAELKPYGWRLPSKDEIESMYVNLPSRNMLYYSDKILDEKYDLAVGPIEEYGDWEEDRREFDKNAPKLNLEPREYDFFPGYHDMDFRKYLGHYMWLKGGVMWTVPIGHWRCRNMMVPGKEFRDKKISVRLIRDIDLGVRDIKKTTSRKKKETT